MSVYRPIVVFSHLRWNFVYQRPQQILSRLAAHRRVLYVEEPIDGRHQADDWELERPAANILVARPRLANLSERTPEDVTATTVSLLRRLVRAEELLSPVAWLYTPMALPLLAAVHPALVVYDCMDELIALPRRAARSCVRRRPPCSNAPTWSSPAASACTGPSRTGIPTSTAFPAAWTCGHFAKAKPGARALAEPADQAAMPRPRLGLLRRDRRAPRHRAAGCRGRVPSRMADRHGRAGREDRPGGAAAAAEHPLPRAAAIRAAAGLSRRLGRVPAAVRAQRRHAVHQPDQDARVHGGRASDREHADHGRGQHVRRHRLPRRHAGCLRSRLRARAGRLPVGPEGASERRPDRARHDQLGPDGLPHGGAHRGSRCRAPPPRSGRSAAPSKRSSPQRVSTLSGRRRPDRPERRLSSRRGCAAASSRTPTVGGWCRSLVDNGFTFDYAGHIMFSQRPLRARALQDAARRQRALAGSRGVDLQQGRLHPLSVPGRALRPAARR